ncbi:hypothetical protein HPB52_020500 [Rhipicephalus sanguineus]|uniref:Uncharacterized protein n=1 Tax=Rhipicephalus sanguineus TaxID=34632 RepID=A0A9D4PSG5_RHISA|nr:hypothetical protein HPB52_020500 [Rhipicephalus sanguineus]
MPRLSPNHWSPSLPYLSLAAAGAFHIGWHPAEVVLLDRRLGLILRPERLACVAFAGGPSTLLSAVPTDFSNGRLTAELVLDARVIPCPGDSRLATAFAVMSTGWLWESSAVSSCSTALAAPDGQLRRPAESIVRDDVAIAARLLGRLHSSRFFGRRSPPFPAGELFLTGGAGGGKERPRPRPHPDRSSGREDRRHGACGRSSIWNERFLEQCAAGEMIWQLRRPPKVQARAKAAGMGQVSGTQNVLVATQA